MVRIRVGDELVYTTLRAKIRLDFHAEGKQRGFLFGGKNMEKLAEETREQKVGLLRNVPLQGVKIDDIDISPEIYTVFDEETQSETAYAPIILTVTADTLEDLTRLVSKEEFRKIEVLDPDHIYLTRFDVERLFFRLNEEVQSSRKQLEKKYSK